MRSLKTKFLNVLFGNIVTEDAAIQLYDLEQDGVWPRAKRFSSVEAAGEFADANDDKNVFFNCALMAKGAKRGKSEDARVLPALFADIDAACGKHDGKRATKAEILAMLEDGFDVPPPSIVIDSGGGIHAYWMFDEPLRDMGLAAELLLGLNDKLKEWHTTQGYNYERLKDLARVLRVPETYNHKTNPAKQVELILPKGTPPVRYSVADLTFGPVADKVEKPTKKVTSDFDVVDDSKTYSLAIGKCLKVEPEWNNDASGFVLKCCRQCVRAGCSADMAVEVVNAIRAIRKFPGDWTPANIKLRYASALEQNELGSAAGEEYEDSEYGFARRVCDLLSDELYGERAMFIHQWSKWVTWTGRQFEVGVAKEIMEATVQVSKQLLDEPPPPSGDPKEDKARLAAHIATCKKYQTQRGFDSIRRIAELMLARNFDSLDKKTDLFHCENYTLRFDSETGAVQKLDHVPSNKNTLLSQVAYIPDAKCPRWEKFISEIAVGADGRPSPGLADYLQRIAGFCLTGRVDNQSIFILHGGGNNGKGAFCRTLLKLLGSFGASVNQDLLIDTKNKGHLTQFATLYGKRCVIAQETDQGCRLNESQVKWLTGGDGIRCRRMREDEWEFEPTHKVMLATNNLPIIRGTDNGIWRRVKLIPFNATVNPDPKLEPSLVSELPGILNWAIEGYRKVVTGQGLAEPPEVELAKAEYKNDMDLVGQFVEEQCILDPTLTTTNTALYQSFKMYCESIGQHVPSLRKLTNDLLQIGVTSGRTESTRFKKGLGLRVDMPPAE
jgi:P4 family phage/plasmid primase-like protien